MGRRGKRDAPQLTRVHSHTRIRSAFTEIKKSRTRSAPATAGPPRARITSIKGSNTQPPDSRARPPTFVPRFTHSSSFLTVSPPLAHARACLLARTLIPSRSHTLSPATVSLTRSATLATSATVASEERSTLRRGALSLTRARDTHRRDRSASQPRALNLIRAAVSLTPVAREHSAGGARAYVLRLPENPTSRFSKIITRWPEKVYVTIANGPRRRLAAAGATGQSPSRCAAVSHGAAAWRRLTSRNTCTLCLLILAIRRFHEQNLFM